MAAIATTKNCIAHESTNPEFVRIERMQLGAHCSAEFELRRDEVQELIQGAAGLFARPRAGDPRALRQLSPRS